MTDILFLLINATLVNNFVLTQAPGLQAFGGKSGPLAIALGMAGATTVVLTLSSGCTWLAYHYLLLPFDLVFLRTLAWLMIIALVASCTALLLQLAAPVSLRVPLVFMPLIVTNCAVLGMALTYDGQANSLVQSVFYGFEAGIAFSLVLVPFTALRERLRCIDVPVPFQGSGILLITAGLVSLAFMGLAGLV